MRALPLPRLLLALLVLAAALVAVPPAPARAAELPAGFRETTAFDGLSEPTVVAFAPDGRVLVAEKNGRVQLFDDLADPTPALYADLRGQVHNFWDRGLLGMAVAPGWPEDPSVYVLYTYDHDPAAPDDLPRWGEPGANGDGCPDPPGATRDGCVVTGRLSRLAPGPDGAVVETPIITDWCQQYPSHSIGSLAFGPDGYLYASAGDGASFEFSDYGQGGSPPNPCGDPDREGGALRSQDVRTAGDPLTLDGTILRIDPATGAGAPGNPLAGGDANAARVIGHGARNPFRFTLRPGTGEVWFGDVGWGTYEEVNRLADPGGAAPDNFGWPCYEGTGRQGGYDSADLPICEALYAEDRAGHQAIAPYLQYRHGEVAADETCARFSGSSIAGLAFYPGGTYPDEYDGALFFADYSRKCVWSMRAGADGLPDPATVAPFIEGASNPVNLVAGPGGDLYYPDLQGGRIVRVAYEPGNRPPVARIDAAPTEGAAPLTVTLDGGGSADPDAGDVLAHAWDLDGDGAHDDATGPTATTTYTTPGT